MELRMIESGTDQLEIQTSLIVGWVTLAHPNHLKNLTLNGVEVTCSTGRVQTLPTRLGNATAV